MRYQAREDSCGAAAISNALRCYGRRVSERCIVKLAKTTPENGTDEHGIQEALAQLKFSCEGFAGRSRDQAWEWLWKQLEQGRPVIINTWGGQHWVCVIGSVAGRVILIDSANTKNNKKENGIHVYGRVEFLKKWRNTKDSGVYFALAVHK